MGLFPVKIKTSIASIVVAVIVVLVSLFLCLVGFMGYGLYNTREKGELNSFIAVQAEPGRHGPCSGVVEFRPGASGTNR